MPGPAALPSRELSVQRYARAAAVLILLSLIGGGLGEMVIPSRFVDAGGATATARAIVESAPLFRLGFACYLLEAICDVALSLVFYVLLRPVSRELSLLAAFFGLVSTSVFAAGQIFYFASSTVLRRGALTSFSADQRADLALLCLKISAVAGGVFLALYGIATIVRGALIWRSGYLPRVLGLLLALGGLCFVVNNALILLAPGPAQDLLVAPMAVAILALMVWLFAKGVDGERWREWHAR